MTELRAKARGAGVYLRVLKNTLARRAVAETPFAGLAEHMIGPAGVRHLDRPGGGGQGAA